MVCEIPFDVLDDLSGKMPKLRQQIMRLMSNEIMGDQEMILLLSKRTPKSASLPSCTISRFVSPSAASPPRSSASP